MLMNQGYDKQTVDLIFQNLGKSNSSIPNPPSQNTGSAPSETINNIGSAPGFNSNDFLSQMEQITEAIIDEKWKEMIRTIEKIVSWKDDVEKRLLILENSFKNSKDDFDKLHTSILGKINNYDKNIVDLGVEIKAMEKVFRNILPNLADNVSELSTIVNKIKGKVNSDKKSKNNKNEE